MLIALVSFNCIIINHVLLSLRDIVLGTASQEAFSLCVLCAFLQTFYYMF